MNQKKSDYKNYEETIDKWFDNLNKKVDNIHSNIKWTDRAIEHFGITDKPHEAGYILYDGQLLNFSGGYKDQRRLDHAEIEQIYLDEELNFAYSNYNPTGSIHLFQINSNALRISVARYGGYIYLSMYVTNHITPAQIETLKYIENYDTSRHIMFDVYDKDNRPIKYGEVSSINELINKISNYTKIQ